MFEFFLRLQSHHVKFIYETQITVAFPRGGLYNLYSEQHPLSSDPRFRRKNSQEETERATQEGSLSPVGLDSCSSYLDSSQRSGNDILGF